MQDQIVTRSIVQHRSPRKTSDTARFLLQRFPQLVSVRNQIGFLPIDYAVMASLPWGPELVEEMCRMDPRVVNEGGTESDGEVPLMRSVPSLHKSPHVSSRVP